MTDLKVPDSGTKVVGQETHQETERKRFQIRLGKHLDQCHFVNHKSVFTRPACLNQIVKQLSVWGHFFSEAIHFVCN